LASRREIASTTALLSVVLDRGIPEALGHQLYRRIRELILSGRLAATARLPSTRRLAEDLGVSRTVTLAAYDQLGIEGYIEARRGSGQYVRSLDRTEGSMARQTPPGRKTRAMPASSLHRDRPFDAVAPAWELFPNGAWARSLARGWRREGALAVSYDNWAGLASLRAAIADHLRALQGLNFTAAHVVITAGNTDALQLIAWALATPRAEVWVEDPGHMGARGALRRGGLEVTPVPVDSEGLDVAAGRRLAPGARFALVTPARQFPLGMPLSLPRRIALLDWANERGAVVIEDDYDSEIRFTGRPLASLASLDTGAAVLSIGSFSKLTFPGLRLGYIVGPERLVARLVRAREVAGTPVATTAQPALAEFISGGGFARHLRTLRQEITHRREALIAALRTQLRDEVMILPQEVGMHLTITLSDSVTARTSDEEIAALARTRGLNLEPLSSHPSTAPGPQGFLLGYAAWNLDRLVAGVEELARLLRC
jgi:GntR family transcriptional regulator/MocR family aminotransferase